MESLDRNVRRRRFLGSALTLGAGAAVGSVVSFPSAGPVLAAGAQDLVEAELLRQLRDGVRGLRGPRPGEAARKVASVARLGSTYLRSKQADDVVRRQVRLLMRREGREVFLRREADPAMLAAELKAFGVTEPFVPEPLDLARRGRVLDAVLTSGITPLLGQVADEFERLAGYLDTVSPVSPVLRRQQCPDVRGQIAFLEYIAALSCLINPIYCAMFAGALAGLKISLILAGC